MPKEKTISHEPIRLFTVNIPERIMERLSADAKEQKRSIGAVIRGILEAEYYNQDYEADMKELATILEKNPRHGEWKNKR